MASDGEQLRCAIVSVEKAEEVLRELNTKGFVNPEFRITRSGGILRVPLLSCDATEFDCEECDPPLRVAGMSPVRRIEKSLRRKGYDGIRIPPKWVRYGDSIVLRIEDQNEELIAKEFISLFGLKSVYKFTGGVEGTYRTPSVRLIAGKGGETTHIENGIRFIFDPEKIMFSPGNVNERVLTSSVKLPGGRVLDLFCGIGYFTLPLAKYSGASEVVAVDINPEAIRYLELSARANHLDQLVKPVNADSFKLKLDEKFDLIMLGNFRALGLLDRALEMASNGGKLVLHHLVSKSDLASYLKQILKTAESAGYKVEIAESHAVKSYSPNVWHYSTTILKR